jgi:hypothetical protein
MNSETYFYIAPEGSRFGPATLEELKAWAARGFITPKSSVESVASGNKLIAQDVPGLAFESSPAGVGAPGASNYPRPPTGDAGVPIPNGIAKSVISTFCIGCLPLGAVALYNSCRVDSLVRAGRFDEARAASKRADTIANVAIVIGCVLFLLNVVSRMMTKHP